MTNQLTKPQILTDEKLMVIGKNMIFPHAVNGVSDLRTVAEAQRDDTFRETLKMVKQLVESDPAEVYIKKHRLIYKLNQLAGGK